MQTRSTKKRKRTISRGQDAVRKTMQRAVELIRARQKQSAVLQDYIAQIDRAKKRRR